MKAAQISKAGGDWELVERDVPQPGAGQVRVKVEACGICHSDVLVKDGVWPGLQYPRVPGHEVAGRIDALGENVTAWTVGQRVGIGWHGYHCFVCEPCRRGDFAMCVNRKVTGIDFDGGYAEYMIAPRLMISENTLIVSGSGEKYPLDRVAEAYEQMHSGKVRFRVVLTT